KVQGTDTYECLLANKKRVVNVDVFRMSLDICPIVEGVNFIDVPDDDTTLAFLIKMGYKGPLYKHPNMFVDHMHHPWRTLVAIINKCLSGKTASNDKLYSVKKSRGKGSQRKKTADDSQETVNVSKESKPKPESVKRKNSSKRRIKTQVHIVDATYSDDPDTALELGKSISQTEAEEIEAARQVYDTHARIMTESVPETTKRRKSGKVTSDPPKKLKGVPSLTPEEQEAVDIIQALKESKKTSKRHPGTGGSNEGTGTIPGAPNESTVISATSSEGSGTKPGVPDEEKDITKENVILKWGSEQESEYSEEDKLDDEEKDNEEVSSNSSLVSTVKDTTNAEINSLLEVKIQSKVPHIQSTSILSIPMFVISEPPVLTPVQESPLITTITNLPPSSVSTTPYVPKQTTTSIPTPTIKIDAPTITTAVFESDALSVVQLRVAKLEKDVSELKKIDLSTKALDALKTQVPYVIDNYLGSKVGDKTPLDILKIKREQAEKQKMLKFTIKSTDKKSLKEFDLKSALYQTMHANKSFNRNLATHQLYHALMEALIEDENAMDKGVADAVKDHKRKHDDDEDPPARPNQGKQNKRRRTKDSESLKKPSTTNETSKGKAPSKGSKTNKSASAKEPVEEPIAEVGMDDMCDDVVRNDDQPQDASKLKTTKTLNPHWFIQPLRPPTPDPDWNKHQYVLNRLKIDNLTQDILLGSAYNLLKGTCSSNIELEYHFQECFNALTDRHEWNNPEGDHYPFDLSKPLPLQGHLGHLAVAADYFFKNDLEYLKSFDPERKYTTSITKTKAARYEIVGIEDMVPTLWSPTKVGYDKDTLKGIKH
ncbi:hypothetical protein Tco_1075475, partial [Tanacetum coccineum]